MPTAVRSRIFLLYPLAKKHGNGKVTFSRMIPNIENGGLSIAMLAYHRTNMLPNDDFVDCESLTTQTESLMLNVCWFVYILPPNLLAHFFFSHRKSQSLHLNCTGLPPTSRPSTSFRSIASWRSVAETHHELVINVMSVPTLTLLEVDVFCWVLVWRFWVFAQNNGPIFFSWFFQAPFLGSLVVALAELRVKDIHQPAKLGGVTQPANPSPSGRSSTYYINHLLNLNDFEWLEINRRQI